MKLHYPSIARQVFRREAVVVNKQETDVVFLNESLQISEVCAVLRVDEINGPLECSLELKKTDAVVVGGSETLAFGLKQKGNIPSSAEFLIKYRNIIGCEKK